MPVLSKAGEILFKVLFLAAAGQICIFATPQSAMDSVSVIERLQPAVVRISGPTPDGASSGLGFIVSEDGKIVTNLHVIKDLWEATVSLSNGERYDQVTVLAFDYRRDLAVIKVPGFRLPTAELGDSDLVQPADPVLAVGASGGFDQTSSAGIISAVRLLDGEGYRVIETDAVINPGNTGGPLVNREGKVIGVVARKGRASETIGLALPINYVRGLLGDLRPAMDLEALRLRLAELQEPRPAIAAAGEVNVIVYRKKTFAGSEFDPVVYCNGRPLVELDNGRYFGLSLQPGQYRIEIDPQGPFFVDFTVQPGQVYFVRLDLGFKTSFHLTSRIVAKKEMQKLKPIQPERVLDPYLVETGDFTF